MNLKNEYRISQWQKIYDVSTKNIKSLLSDLDFNFDYYLGESDVISLLPDFINNLNLGIFKTYLVILKFILMISIMSLMAYSTTLTSYKFMNNQRVTIDLELYFYPFYFICSIGMWLSVLAILVWFVKTLLINNLDKQA